VKLRGPDVPQGAKATGALLDNVASSIHAGQQGKHVLGHNNFLPGRSYLNEVSILKNC
jgi:filamentous hemagglutinin